MPRSVQASTSMAPGAGRPVTPRSERSKPARVMSRKTKSPSPFRARMTAGVLAGGPRLKPAGKGAGRLGTGGALQAVGKGGAAVGIGRRRAEDLVVLGDQLQLDAIERAGCVERAGEDV